MKFEPLLPDQLEALARSEQEFGELTGWTWGEGALPPSEVRLGMASVASERPDWLGLWILSDEGEVLGSGGYREPPRDTGFVEIGYGIGVDRWGQGLATALAGELTRRAFLSPLVQKVRAHTLPDGIASQRVLTKCGFRQVGSVIDPDDGVVLRFEIEKPR